MVQTYFERLYTARQTDIVAGFPWTLHRAGQPIHHYETKRLAQRARQRYIARDEMRQLESDEASERIGMGSADR